MWSPTASRWRSRRWPRRRRRQDHRGRAKPRADAQFPPAAAVGPGRHQPHSATSPSSRRTRKRSRVGALTRHHQLETSPVIARHLPVLRRRHDACRASGDPQPRHHRRQPVACRPGRRTADDGAAARCRASTLRRRRVGARSRRAISSWMRSRSTSPRTRSSPRSCCRNCRRTPAGVSRRSRAAAAISRSPPSAATLTLSDGTIAQARIAMTGVGATPARAAEAEALLVGSALEPASDRRRDRSRARGRRAGDRSARFGGLSASSGRRARRPRARRRMAPRNGAPMSTRDDHCDGQRHRAIGTPSSRGCCSPISCAARSASPARMSAASTACAAPARCWSTATACAPA